MLGEATLTSAQQTFEGALEIAGAGGRPIVSGTLAADGAALAPLLGPPDRLYRPGRRMERATFRARCIRRLSISTCASPRPASTSMAERSPTRPRPSSSRTAVEREPHRSCRV